MDKSRLNTLLKSHVPKSSRLFLYIGLGLVVLAILAFPIKARFIGETPGASETYGIGWLFAPVIGMFGFAGIILGLAQSPKSHAVYFLLVLVIMYAGLGFAGWMAVVYATPLWQMKNPFWWAYFFLFLIPTAISTVTFILRCTKKDSLQKALSNKKIKLALGCLLVLIPILFSAFFLYTLFSSGNILYLRY